MLVFERKRATRATKRKSQRNGKSYEKRSLVRRTSRRTRPLRCSADWWRQRRSRRRSGRGSPRDMATSLHRRVSVGHADNKETIATLSPPDEAESDTYT